MKVKDVLAKMELENAEAEVIPVLDASGKVTLTVQAPEHSLGDPISNSEEAKKTLVSHIDRIERIRMAVGSFFGLPVAFKVHATQQGEWVELVVKSPTGRTVAIVEIRIKYVLQHSEYGWHQEPVGHQAGSLQRFRDVAPDIAGYDSCIHKYVITGQKLAEAIQRHCEAPKWLEVKRETE